MPGLVSKEHQVLQIREVKKPRRRQSQQKKPMHRLHPRELLYQVKKRRVL